MSTFTAYTDISIDPIIRLKAEKILDKVQRLDVIQEEGILSNKLNSMQLKTLD